ncbi:unnamed protein product [Gadus morhua 'NCC']
MYQTGRGPCARPGFCVLQSVRNLLPEGDDQQAVRPGGPGAEGGAPPPPGGADQRRGSRRWRRGGPSARCTWAGAWVDVQRFRQQKDRDIREALIGYALMQISMCKKGVQMWSNTKECFLKM